MRAYRKSRSEIDELAARVVRREVYLAHVASNGFQHSFGWLFMLMKEPPRQSELETIAACYEEMGKALPRGVNGYPMFTSCQFVHVNDMEQLHERILRKEQALAEA